MGLVSNRRLTINIILLSIVPLIVVVVIVASILFSQAKQLVDDQVALTRLNVLSVKKQELKQYVEMAVKSIKPYYEDESLSPQVAKQLVAEKLSQLTYGEDGYFFVYSWQGDALVLPYQPERVGRNWWGVEDLTGKKLLQELIHAGRAGGGFVNYLWHKPSTKEPLPKLSYAISLDKWQWMVGTGVYIDDIEKQVAQMENGFDQNIGKTSSALFVLMFVAITVIAGLGASLNLNMRRLANEQLSVLNQQIIDSQENERHRVSRELHDGVNQLLVAAKYRLDNVTKEQDDEKKQLELDASKNAMEQAIVEVRRISKDLRPPQLDDLGLVAGIEAYLNELRERTQLEVIFEHDIEGEEFLPQVETTLYRVVQEALHNVEKHANAQGVDIIMQREGRMLILTVSDDGVGIPANHLKAYKNKQSTLEHMGLQNMKERIQAIGGMFEVNSEPGQGTEIRVSLNMEFI
ncbi:cache domain-containing protein [Vibrio natriegens]|jgi:two-component system NarL family sensor kinase|uniref:cache domain-containing protein n=1 Tax=Vibrio TaxID=662 RepID=UPI0008047853|nr:MULTISPECIES: cache domain-containing protein [Vibrio]ANQ29336.1 histidine kinase [Vibrio natriegens]AXT72699.1 histidine kinase [Vibrio sp. dhg]MCG9698883.1 cache domain-containing protein [Vibrio natriegens]MCY9879075.1 cache domain-containing protein [Vibrio natriegens]